MTHRAASPLWLSVLCVKGIPIRTVLINSDDGGNAPDFFLSRTVRGCVMLMCEGDTRQRSTTHAVLHHRNLHGLVLPCQPHPRHRRHVV